MDNVLLISYDAVPFLLYISLQLHLRWLDRWWRGA
jgi:hypothetical protein